MSDRPSFVYVTYINTSAEKLWTALTDGKFTREYWGGRAIASDWKVGSEVRLTKQNGSDDGARINVLEIDPPAKLVLSWRSGFQPTGPATRVTFTIQPAGPKNVKLTVVHEEYEPGSMVHDMLREGWSAILSSLKTFLETGEALDVTRRWAETGN